MARLELTAAVHGAPGDLDVLMGAVGPEREGEIPGVEASLVRSAPDHVRLVLAGEAPSPLRAACNAYLRWVRTVQEVLDVAAPAHPPPEESP